MSLSIAMRRRVMRAHADYESSHPLSANGPSPTAPLLSGFIRKRSPALLHVWQSRYFVLYPAVLVYSRSMGSTMLGALAILSVVWMDARDDSRLDISVEAEDGTGLGKERVMQLQMDSDEERDMWLGRLSQQLSIIKRDHSSASHSRSISAGGQFDNDSNGSELKQQTDELKPGTSLLFRQQKKEHAHTPYLAAADTSSRPVPSLQLHEQQQHTQSLSPPLPPHGSSKHHGLSPPSFLNKIIPSSPLSVVKHSKQLASYTTAGHSPLHSNVPQLPPASLSSITALSLAAASSLPASSYPIYGSSSSPSAAAAFHELPVVSGLTTRSSSCYTDRPTSASRPLIQRLIDVNARTAASASIDAAATVQSALPPSPPTAPHPSELVVLSAVHRAEASRSRSVSTSRSALSPPPPSGGLLDEGIVLTLFCYTAEYSTLSLCDVVLAYCSHSRALTCRPAAAEDEAQQQQQQLILDVDELQSVAIGRHSDTMRRLSTHISSECCLTVACADGTEVNVVAKGAALIKLLHKELSILIGGLAADELALDDGDSTDELHSVDQQLQQQEADDKLDDAAVREQRVTATPLLAPYQTASNLVPILSTSPNLTRSRSAPAGATLRFQDKIEVHEYVQPASYTPSQEDEPDDEHTAEMLLTYCQHDDDDDTENTGIEEAQPAAVSDEDGLELLPTSLESRAADEDVVSLQAADDADSGDDDDEQRVVSITVDEIVAAPPLHPSSSGCSAASHVSSSQSAISRDQYAAPSADCQPSNVALAASSLTAHSSPPSAEPSAATAMSADGEPTQGKLGGLLWNTAAASLAALMQGLANSLQPTVDIDYAAERPTANSPTAAAVTSTSTSPSAAASPTASSSRSLSSSSPSAAVHAFGVRLRSVSSRSAASSSVAQPPVGSDALSAEVLLPAAPQLSVSESVGAAEDRADISLTLDFDIGYPSPSAAARSIAAAQLSTAEESPTPTNSQHSLPLPVTATPAQQQLPLEDVAADGGRLPGAGPSHTSSMSFAPAARLLPSLSSSLALSRSSSTPASVASLLPNVPSTASSRYSVAPPPAHQLNQGGTSIEAIRGSVSVSALKSLWMMKSADSSPTTVKQQYTAQTGSGTNR